MPSIKDRITVLRTSQNPEKLKLETYKKIESSRTKEQAWQTEKSTQINATETSIKKHSLEALNSKKPFINLIEDQRTDLSKEPEQIKNYKQYFNESVKDADPKAKALFLLHNPTVVKYHADTIENRLDPDESDTEKQFEKVKDYIAPEEELLPSYRELKAEHISSSEQSNSKTPTILYPETKFLHRGEEEDYMHWNLRGVFLNPYKNKRQVLIEQNGAETKVSNEFLNHLNNIFKLKT